MDVDDCEITFPLQITSLKRLFIQLISFPDDYQFQEFIGKFLPVLIRSIDGQNDEFKNKALEVFIHVNKRVKSRPQIQIPVKDLLDIFNSSRQASPLVSNFSLMYIKIGFMRLQGDEQVDLIPSLFQSIADRPVANQELLMGLLVYAIQKLKLVPNSNENVVKYGLTDQAPVRQVFLNFLLNVLLLSYKFEDAKAKKVTASSHRSYVEPSQAPVDEVLFSTMDDAPSKEVEVFKQPFPCMNEKLHNRIIEAIQTDELSQVEKLKVGILKFLNANIYHEDEILFHFVLATADARYSVVLAAEHDIKRLTVAVDWNKTQHVQSLFEFFLGTAKTVKQQSITDECLVRNPSNIRIRLKLFPYLLKSKAASTIFPHAIQILYEGLFGNSTNVRVKYQTLQFGQNIIQNSETNTLLGISKLILNAVEKVLNTETSKTHDSSRLRSLSYVLIGKLSYRVPSLFADDIRLTQNLFESLKNEDNECCLNIQEALTLLAFAQKDGSPASKLMLEHLLTEQVIVNRKSNIEAIDYPNCRQAAVNFVMNAFPTSDATSRFILLAACSDKNEDIRSLAIRNLFNDQNKSYPSFESLFELILKNAHGNYQSDQELLAYHPQTYQEMIYFLHRCLIEEGFNGEKATPFWKYEEKLPSILEKAKKLGLLWKSYIDFLKKFVVVVADSLSCYFLLESVIVTGRIDDPKFIEYFQENLSSFRQIGLFCSRDETRFFGSILYGFVLSKIDFNVSSIDELMKIISNPNQRFEQRDGALISLSFFSSYRKFSEEFLQKIKNFYLKMFFDEHRTFLYSLLIGIGQLARAQRFNDEDRTQIESFIEQISPKLRTTKENNRIKEKIIQTLAFLAVCYRDRSSSIIDLLTESIVETKQVELQLNIGDALICCIVGSSSPLVKDPYLLIENCAADSETISNEEISLRYQLIEQIFRRVLQYSSDLNNPHTRQAAMIWLLTFLIHCRELVRRENYRTVFESNLFLLEKNLIFGLIDQDELNQELSCKCLIYLSEIIENEKLRTQFNNSLFEQFSDSTKSFSSQKTTLAYEHNLQTTTIENSQLSLYKELCSMVDLKDLDQNEKSQFFYALLYLAHENSIWSTTRYGQVFCFNEHEQKSIEFITKFIEKIIPRLYRLLFDPQSRVQESIKRIWKKLFSSKKQSHVVENYFSLIFNDLYQDLLSSRWRVRESVQLALFEIFRISNRRLIDNQEYLKIFRELFRRLLSVCDDTKESVRKAALITLNSFKQNCLLLACDPSTTISSSASQIEQSQRGKYVLEQILPILLNDGLYNKNEDIAKFSLSTIMEIIRYGDVSTLKPYCTVIIVALFEALSSVEPDIFNYASMKLSAAEMKEQVDVARLICARSSPMMDAINTCTNQYVGEEIFDDLSSKLVETIKQSVGLTTKCLIGQYFITLSNIFPQVSSKYVGKWMAVLVNTMSVNSNRTLRKTFTSVLGTIVRIAKRSSIENLLQKISTWYFQVENDYQYVCALTLNSIAQFNNEMLIEHGKIILPLIFLAMQETKTNEKTDDQQQEDLIWKNLWFEHTSSFSTAIQNYIKEILEQIRRAIEQNSYSMKIKAARAVQTIAEQLKGNLQIEDLTTIVDFMLKGFYGRVYDGKENFLLAMESICSHCKDTVKTSSELVGKIYDSILKECKKESLVYRSKAIRVLGLLADEYDFQVYPLFWTWFEKTFKPEEPSEESCETDEDPLLNESYRRTLIECLPKFWPKNVERQKEFIEETVSMLIEIIHQSSWQNQLVLVQSLNKLIRQSSTRNSFSLIRLFEPVINLGPRSKSANLKREVLDFVEFILETREFSVRFEETLSLRNLLDFNIEEMILDTRSTEISERAKNLKKNHENLFEKIFREEKEKSEIPKTDEEDRNIF